MGLKDDLQAEVAAIFKAKWEERDGIVVPDDDSVKLGNDAVKLDATVLYADLADSTALVDGYKPWFAAEIYKTFLLCAAKIIRSEKGVHYSLRWRPRNGCLHRRLQEYFCRSLSTEDQVGP